MADEKSQEKQDGAGKEAEKDKKVEIKTKAKEEVFMVTY